MAGVRYRCAENGAGLLAYREAREQNSSDFRVTQSRTRDERLSGGDRLDPQRLSSNGAAVWLRSIEHRLCCQRSIAEGRCGGVGWALERITTRSRARQCVRGT